MYESICLCMYVFVYVCIYLFVVNAVFIFNLLYFMNSEYLSPTKQPSLKPENRKN